jgi:hypothetical protein
MAIAFTILRQDRLFKARAGGEAPFFVGYATRYFDKGAQQEIEGLYNVPTKLLPKLLYTPADIQAQHGFWADFIWPTAQCEGGNYLTLNTYDRAGFTWGFGQFAAHVPNGDFVRFMRAMLLLPEANAYFPDLALDNGHIARLAGGQLHQLENAQTTAPLMSYLNPTTTAIEDSEVIAAARFIHWTTRSAAPRELQAGHMVETFLRLMKEADQRLGLDGRSADICCVICDIRHQGRAKYTAIQAALASGAPYAELLKLGSISYPGRLKTLRQAIDSYGPAFRNRVWDRASGSFR